MTSPLDVDCDAIIHLCGGHWEKAEGHYHTALRQARELLDEAIAMYRQIGMPRHVEMAEALLGEI